MRSSLRDETNDDLTAQEREFLQSGGAKPAASVRRIGKHQQRPAATAPTNLPPTLAEDKPTLQILGEVVEKARRPFDQIPSTGQQDAGPREAFPKATHRRESKFSLARKAKTQPHEPSEKAREQSAPHRMAPSIAGKSAPRTPGAHAPAPATARAPQSTDAEPGDPAEEKATVQQMMQENDEFISKLSVTEIRHLQEQIHGEIKPDLLSKLAARKRKPQQSAPATTDTGKPAQQAPPAAPPATPHPLRQQVAKPSAGAVRPQALDRQPGANPAQLPALVRTRFATDGLPVGWVSDEEVAGGTAAAGVAMRDPLRRDEGSVAVGYTVEEAVVLLRSTHSHLQRAGLKTLAALAWRARPRLADVWQAPGGPAPRRAEGFMPARPQGVAAAAAVPWQQVWAHLQHESLIAAPVLQLLQRPATVDASVRAEALSCLAALLGVPWEARVLIEHAWGRPFVGWPMTPTAALRRRVPAAPWQMAAEPVLPPDGELQPPDPLTVLESDALLGALFMGLLPALAVDLASPHNAQRAAALDILFAVVANGPEACLSVLACAPLLRALRGMMVTCGEQGEPSAAARMVHVRTLEVVQLVAASSPDAARGISNAGLLDMPRAVLLSEEWASPGKHPVSAGPAAPARAASVLGCLRLWRACVPARVYFAALSDAFPCIMALLEWAQRACGASSCVATSHAASPAYKGAADAAPAAQPLYIPDAAKQQDMQEQLRQRDAAVQMSIAPAGDASSGSAVHGPHAVAIAHAVAQEVALLLTVLLQHDIPAHAAQPVWMERRSCELPEGSEACEPMCSPGCVQQMVPHLVELLRSTGAAGGGGGSGEDAWQAATEWLRALAVDADASEGLSEEQLARQGEESLHQPPLPPARMHAVLLLPPAARRQGAISACLLAVDALATPRQPDGLPVVADRVELLSQVMQQPCCQGGVTVPRADRRGLPLLQQCLQVADACEAAAVRAALHAREASAARRAGRDVGAGAAAPALARTCVQAAHAVACVGGSAAAASGAGLAFGPWAAVRTQATHVVAAGLLRCLRMLATLSGGKLPAAFATGADMLAVLRALVLVPTLTTSADIARQALQVMFSAPAVAPCSAAAAQAFSRARLDVSPAAAAEQLVPGAALLAAYCAAWTGSAAPAPLPSASSTEDAAAEPVGEQLPCMWMDAATGAGQRLPAPPDWFVLAVAARVDAAGSGEGATTTGPSGGELSAALLAAVVTWVVGLMHGGVCDTASADVAPALMRGWGRKAIVTNVLRMVYLTADVALGPRDAHSAIMQDILGCSALRLALQACMATLAADPVPSAVADPALRTQGPQAAMHILQRLGQLTVADPVAPPEAAGHSGATVGDVADELAQQHASASLGDPTFGHAVLLLCRPDWGCADSVWRALSSGGSLSTLPPLAGAVGGGEQYVAAAAEEVARCTGAGASPQEALRGAAAAGAVALEALREGRWDGKMLKRCSTASAAGVLWGAWLLGTICKCCRVRVAGELDRAGTADATVAGEAGGHSGLGGGSGMRWQLQLVHERLQDEDAGQAAVQLVAAVVWWAAKCLHADAAEVAHALEIAAASELAEALGEGGARLSDAVGGLRSGSY